MSRIMESIKNKKRVWVCVGILIVLLSIWFIPFVYTRVQLSALHVENVSRIVYVEYEDTPFSSEVKSKKVSNDDAHIQDFVKMFKDGSITLRGRDEEPPHMLFLYYEDGEVVNAYVSEDSLGFQYGKYWVDIKGLDGFISSMESIDSVEVHELSGR